MDCSCTSCEWPINFLFNGRSCNNNIPELSMLVVSCNSLIPLISFERNLYTEFKSANTNFVPHDYERLLYERIIPSFVSLNKSMYVSEPFVVFFLSFFLSFFCTLFLFLILLCSGTCKCNNSKVYGMLDAVNYKGTLDAVNYKGTTQTSIIWKQRSAFSSRERIGCPRLY